MIAAFLPSPGYAVVRAYGGAEAITLAQRLHPDLILLDLMMPEVNGFDVVEALQRRTGHRDIPILVVTAKHVTADERAALDHESGAAPSTSWTRPGSTARASWPRCGALCRRAQGRRTWHAS